MKTPNKALTTPDGELRNDLTDKELARFRPASEVVPENVMTKLRGRPKAAFTKERITIRLSPEVVNTFRATGDGWQTRLDIALNDWLKTHDPKNIRT